MRQWELKILQLVSTVDQHTDIPSNKQSTERCINPIRHSTTRHTQTVHSLVALSVRAENVKDKTLKGTDDKQRPPWSKYNNNTISKIHQPKASHALEEKSGDATDNSTRLTDVEGPEKKVTPELSVMDSKRTILSGTCLPGDEERIMANDNLFLEVDNQHLTFVLLLNRTET